MLLHPLDIIWLKEICSTFIGSSGGQYLLEFIKENPSRLKPAQSQENNYRDHYDQPT